ncbi:MAG TPA: TRAM domain-containing protein [Myxococcaceae bacterium]
MRPPRRKPGPPPRARGRAGAAPASEAKQVSEGPIDVEVERLSADGEGVASWKGRALFVPDALPGEAVRVVPAVEGKIQRGKLLEVLRPAPERILPGCPLAGICGGCDWLHLAPAAERRERENAVRAALERLGGLDLSHVSWLPTLAAGDLGTRRRADLTWTGTALGYLHRRSHDPVPVAHCPALVGSLADLPGRLPPLLAPLGRRLRAVRLLSEGEKVAVALELAGPINPLAREVALAIVRSGVRGVVLVPESGASEDVGRPTIRGPAPLRPEVSLLFRPEAFAQAHGEGTPLLVQRTLGLLAPKREHAALELYAGNGTFTVALAARAASVLAVESSPLSVRLAVSASTQARLDNVRFVQGEVEKVCRGLVKEGRRFDVLLADPPRTGAPGLATLARDLGVRRLLYVACDAGALARDAAGLTGAGFRLTTLQLVDMFPGTHHSETLAAFESGPE